MDMSDLLATCLPYVRVPNYGDNVYKDECLLSFETAKSNGGLYICLSSFLGFGSKFVNFYHNITKKRIFLCMKKIKKEQPASSNSNEQSPLEKRPKRFAIGVEGGFNPDANKEEFEEINTIVILPEYIELPLDAVEEIDSKILISANSVLSIMSASKKEEAMAWDGEIRQVSKHAMDLKQLDNGVKIPPSGWKCQACCDATNNLWLNLSDGFIGCGRRYFDGTGGNDGGLKHFKETGFPLAVKLGTITPNGADVHSYDEDTMVDDPLLAKHLAHFGINMMSMQKTEQTMAELEIELNEKLGNEWDIIQEAGKKLKELHGPGLTGIENMGNTCYMNSLFQVLFSTSSFLKSFTSPDKCAQKFKTSLKKLNIEDHGYSDAKMSVEIQNTVQDICEDLELQLCKLGLALYGGTMKDGFDNGFIHDDDATNKDELRPRVLKKLIGKGHSEFSSCKQQDVHEYFLHTLSLLEKMAKKNKIDNPGHQFQYMAEERIECQETKHVRYTNRPDYALALPVPIECATNKDEVAEYEKRKEANKKDVKVEVGQVIRSKVPFSACLENFMADEVVEDFWSSAALKKVTAHKCSRMQTFPEYLVIQLKKFTVGLDWVPKKLDVSVNMPDELDINCLRGKGMQHDEIALPEEEREEVAVNQEGLITLMEMGFPRDRCKQALLANNNMVETAAMWLFENGASDPTPPAADDIPEDSIAMVISMGFTRDQATNALRQTSNSVERAIDWIFSHPDDMGTPAPSSSNENVQTNGDDQPSSTPTPPTTDGPGNYELFAFISHMGSSTLCGHYVCHIKKNDRWTIFNDEKVAESVEPPKDLGYLYFYKRKDVSV